MFFGLIIVYNSGVLLAYIYTLWFIYYINIFVDTIFIFICFYHIKIVKLLVQKIWIKLILIQKHLIFNLPFIIFFYLFSIYIKNPLLYSIFMVEWYGIVLYLISNIILIKIFKNFFFLFDFNRVIYLFLCKIYKFLTFNPLMLYKSLYSTILIPYMPTLSHMETIGRTHVQSIANRAMYKARTEMDNYRILYHDSIAVCAAIPDKNNQWHMVFHEEARRSLSQYKLWREQFNHANWVDRNVLERVRRAHDLGRDLNVPFDWII